VCVSPFLAFGLLVTISIHTHAHKHVKNNNTLLCSISDRDRRSRATSSPFTIVSYVEKLRNPVLSSQGRADRGRSPLPVAVTLRAEAELLPTMTKVRRRGATHSSAFREKPRKRILSAKIRVSRLHCEI